MPISEQAFKLCGEPRQPEQLVFEGLPNPSWISRPLRAWIEKAGIQKHLSFHCLGTHLLPFNLQTEQTSIL